jgi:hypothetical protein
MSNRRLDFEKRERRFHQPDGMCFQCEEPANYKIKVSGPHSGKEVHEFCCWECVSRWAAVRADGKR